MISSTDQLGRKIILKKYPSKIISLVPSISELIWDLNLQEELIGITKFCIHPDEMFQRKTRIGGTKNLHLDLIKELNPELIIANKEENTQEEIEFLSNHFNVWISDVNTFNDAIHLIKEIGELTNRKKESELLIDKIIQSDIKITNNKKIVYLIWNEPHFAVGKNTFIDSMLEKAGFLNCIQETRYPEITDEKIKEINPDYLFLSSEPFPFKQNHIEHFAHYLPIERIILVNGEMFSWYGSRMIKAFEYFQKINYELKHGR